jgi:hypothetical protein
MAGGRIGIDPMAFDLALNRLTHDMVFHKSSQSPSDTNWDSGTTWDISTAWDSPVQKYELWAIDGADKVAQQIKITLLAFLGEWFLNTAFGVPYLEEILIKNPRMASVEVILRNAITNVPNVISIDSFTLFWDRQKRILSVEFACSTDLGPIKESVKLEVLPRV